MLFIYDKILRKTKKETEKLENKDLLHSTGNYVQYSVINHNGKNMKKNVCIYVYKLNHFSVHQKLIQHCKSTILQ